MTKNTVRKKPTAREMASAIIEINTRVNELYKITRELDSVVGLFIEMKGDKEKFNVYVDKKYSEYQKAMEKKDEQKANGKVDKGDIPANPNNPRSGTEGIRQESK
jgi:hypothetical protein